MSKHAQPDGGFDENMADAMTLGAIGAWLEIQQQEAGGHVCEGNGQYKAAAEFLEACGLRPNPDAIEQLADGFLPALRIICGRAHAPNGATWKKAGWRGQLFESMKKSDRLHYRSWERGLPDLDSADDIINYMGFYRRGITSGLTPWGQWGDPGNMRGTGERPTVVAICGSGKFTDIMFDVAERETLLGKIVLRPDVNTKAREISARDKEELDVLHLRKIDLADEVIIVSQGGYIGDSTRGEIRYAMEQGKNIVFIEPEAYHKMIEDAEQ